MEANIRSDLIRYQKEEKISHLVFQRLAAYEKNPANKKILEKIAGEEEAHYLLLAQYTGVMPEAGKFMVWFYTFLPRILGLTFGIKLLELQEERTIKRYRRFDSVYPEIAHIAEQEEEHEHQLIDMIETKTLGYMGAIVLGMNDALVELTGSLAGFTLALQNSMMIALLGSITGIAAAMSMAASEYLSVKADKGTKTALKAASYTGIAYLLTVILLVTPFALIHHPLYALILTLSIAVVVIAAFNFYYSVVKGESFKIRFAEMLIISFTVVVISFGFGYFLKKITGIEV